MLSFPIPVSGLEPKKIYWFVVTAIIMILLFLAKPLWAYINSHEIPSVSPQILNTYDPAHIVILYRHAERCDRSFHPCYANQGGITIQGTQSASKMGEKVSNSFNGHYEIMSSDALRTRQTAHFFAEGKAVEIDSKLNDKQCNDAQYQHFLSAIQHNNKNMKIIFTHSTCLNYFANRFANEDFDADYLSNLVIDITDPQHVRVIGSLVLN